MIYWNIEATSTQDFSLLNLARHFPLYYYVWKIEQTLITSLENDSYLESFLECLWFPLVTFDLDFKLAYKSYSSWHIS